MDVVRLVGTVADTTLFRKATQTSGSSRARCRRSLEQPTVPNCGSGSQVRWRSEAAPSPNGHQRPRSDRRCVRFGERADEAAPAPAPPARLDVGRDRTRRPPARTWSFPSGHAASWVAFRNGIRFGAAGAAGAAGGSGACCRLVSCPERPALSVRRRCGRSRRPVHRAHRSRADEVERSLTLHGREHRW